MLSSQRHLFNIPQEVVYLNTAYMSPLLNSVVEAIDKGVRSKAHPWKITISNFYEDIERARILFSGLTNSNPENIAIIPSASYGIQIAANNIKIEAGKKILILKDQFPSNVYPWQRISQETGCHIVRIERGNFESLTDAILNNLDETVAVAALPNVLWTDGSLLDLIQIRLRCDEIGCALVLDLTQSAGAVWIDFKTVRPDFAVVANYKWMLGPYTTGFLYASAERFEGAPLEEGWITRKDSKNFSNLVKYTDNYDIGAIRYDMGERSNFALMPGVIAALEQIKLWEIKNIEQKLFSQNRFLGKKLTGLGLEITDEKQRAPHFLGVKIPNDSRNDLLSKLSEKNIYLSERGGTIRITPHLWNTQEDFEKFIYELKKLI